MLLNNSGRHQHVSWDWQPPMTVWDTIKFTLEAIQIYHFTNITDVDKVAHQEFCAELLHRIGNLSGERSFKPWVNTSYKWQDELTPAEFGVTKLDMRLWNMITIVPKVNVFCVPSKFKVFGLSFMENPVNISGYVQNCSHSTVRLK